VKLASQEPAGPRHGKQLNGRFLICALSREALGFAIGEDGHNSRPRLLEAGPVAPQGSPFADSLLTTPVVPLIPLESLSLPLSLSTHLQLQMVL
jgi:hypothetical protein